MRYQLASLIARAAKKRISALEGVSFRGGSWAGEAAVWESDSRSAGGDSPGRILQGRRFASVDAVDREDHRPPSLRKSAARVEEVVLRAFPRLKPGRLCCKKERRNGLVPSIVFEQENGHLGGNKQLLSVEKQQLENIVNKIGRSFFMSRTFDLEIYDRPGQSLLSRETVLPRTIHLHAVTDQLLNVTFMKASPHSELKVEVPLVFIGEDSCPGIRKGGYVNTIMRKVPYSCRADAIPPFVEVDISTLNIGDKILLCDLKVKSQLKLLHKDRSLPVLKIMGTRSMDVTSSTK